jgi:hypothetical protein
VYVHDVSAAAIILGLSAVLAVAIGVAVGRARGWRLGALWAAALPMLAVACIDPAIRFGARPRVAVLVDLSPSTRGLWFKDPERIRKIEAALRSSSEIRLLAFGDEKPIPLDLAKPLQEISADRTVLPTVDADAVVLLSDGQFSATSTRVPTFPVVDSTSTPDADARIARASFEHNSLTVRVENGTSDRTLNWPDGTSEVVVPGVSTLRREVGRREIAVALKPGDLWPENDRIVVSPSDQPLRRIWIGEDPATGFEQVDLASLDLAGISRSGVVVLNDVEIASMPIAFQQGLDRYVREFGGSLVIGGGPHALSAGGYGNTIVDALSPLASLPPAPTNDLFVIVDSSGSMASATPDGRTKLDVAVDAMSAIDRVVPETWSLRAGSISRDLRWWPGERVKRPGDLVASGPTNLAAAIRAVLSAEAEHPRRLILISDGQTEPASLTELSTAVVESKLTIDWLALPPAEVNGPLARLVRASGGRMIAASAADTWRADAQALARGAISSPMIKGPFEVSLEPVGSLSIDSLNTVHVREGAEVLASVSGQPVAARWNVGLGKVTTLAFQAANSVLDAVAAKNARLPRDPRFSIQVDADEIELRAQDDAGPMNILPLSLLIEENPVPLEQTGPGRYSAPIDRTNSPRIASVRLGGALLDTFLIPARYPPEFEAIGMNLPNLDALARSSNGRVIEPSELRTLSASLPARASRSLRVPALVIALLCITGVLILSRRAAVRASTI